MRSLLAGGASIAGQGCPVLCCVDRPGGLGILLQQALALQAAAYTLANQLNQILDLAYVRHPDAPKLWWPVVAMENYPSAFRMGLFGLGSGGQVSHRLY